MLINTLLLCCFVVITSGGYSGHSLAKRSLLFPKFTVLQFTYGVSAPVILPKRSINLSMCVQCNFEMPFNVSHFFPTVFKGRTLDYDLDRPTFYKYVIEILNGVGLQGESCLLRSICEIAEVPMHTDDVENNLLEGIVHFLFSPTEDYYLEEAYNRTINNVYVKAEMWGKTYGKCHKKYTRCPISIVDLFTKMFHVQ